MGPPELPAAAAAAQRPPETYGLDWPGAGAYRSNRREDAWIYNTARWLGFSERSRGKAAVPFLSVLRVAEGAERHRFALLAVGSAPGKAVELPPMSQ